MFYRKIINLIRYNKQKTAHRSGQLFDNGLRESLGLRDLLKQESLQVGRKVFVLERHEHFARIGEIHSADFMIPTPVTVAGK